MENNDSVIKFITEDNEEISFSVLEQTTLNGANYLLVTEDPDSDEAESYILKEVREEGTEVIYDMVDDEKELNALADVFAELLEDTDIKLD